MSEWHKSEGFLHIILYHFDFDILFIYLFSSLEQGAKSEHCVGDLQGLRI